MPSKPIPSNNNVLYLEADEEITSAIDKMVKMASADVKIVVPKRSTLLQSLVNLKLLKKAAEDGGKNLVLVTSDRTSSHLAARLGLPVAATLTSNPQLQEVKQLEPDVSDELEAEDEPDTDAPTATPAPNPLEAKPEPTAKEERAPIGASKPSYAKPMLVRKAVGLSEAETAATGMDAMPAAGEVVKGKKPRVPDFNKMQKRLMWGGIAVVAVILLLVLNYYITSAKLTIYVQGSKISASFPATVDPTIKTSDPAHATLAATNLASSHDLTETTDTSGKKDVGTKAGGNITVTNYCYNPGTLPAGTIFTAANGHKFSSTQDVAVPAAIPFKGACTSTTASVPVAAAANGDDYNLAAGTLYTVGSASSSDLKGTGAQMSGGTSKTVNVVTQADVDKATAELLAKDKDGAQKDLENKMASGLKALSPSFAQTTGTVTPTPSVGTQADQVQVDVKASYTELAVASSDIEAVLKDQELQQIGVQNQIYDDGISNLTITPNKNNVGAASTFTFAAEAYGGAKLDSSAIAKQLVGQRAGDASDTANKIPGVVKVDLVLSPFWATSMPHIAGHIHVTIKVSNSTN